MSSIYDASEQVFEVVAEIPMGKVMSYQQIAQAAGIKSPRWVGRILHRNDDPEHVPCHRVVHADGTLAQAYVFGGIAVQKQRLIAEGVKFIGEYVDMSSCSFTPHMF